MAPFIARHNLKRHDLIVTAERSARLDLGNWSRLMPSLPSLQRPKTPGRVQKNWAGCRESRHIYPKPAVATEFVRCLRYVGLSPSPSERGIQDRQKPDVCQEEYCVEYRASIERVGRARRTDHARDRCRATREANLTDSWARAWRIPMAHPVTHEDAEARRSAFPRATRTAG